MWWADLIMMAMILAAPVIFIWSNVTYEPPPRCEEADQDRDWYNVCVKERGHEGRHRSSDNRYFE